MVNVDTRGRSNGQLGGNVLFWMAGPTAICRSNPTTIKFVLSGLQCLQTVLQLLTNGLVLLSAAGDKAWAAMTPTLCDSALASLALHAVVHPSVGAETLPNRVTEDPAACRHCKLIYASAYHV